MKFKPSLAAEEFIESVHTRVGARNKAVLGRAALFLSLGKGLPDNFRLPDAQGKDLDDDTVIGEELRDVVRAALNYRANRSLDEAGYRTEFRKHFEFGCQQLKSIWEDAGKDQARFVTELLRIGGDEIGLPQGARPSIAARGTVDTAVEVKLMAEGEPWRMNDTTISGQNNSLLIISGQPGSGKSQLALDLLAQLARQGVRFVFFDLKGELEDDPENARQRENRTKFLSQTGARYVRLIQEDLPINPLWRDRNDTVNAQTAYEIASLIAAFAPQLGARQVSEICDAYTSLAAPDFVSLLAELEQSGADGVERAIIKRIVDVNLFASSATSIPVDEWLEKSLVIDFKQFGNDNATKSIAVALILNLLMKKGNRQLAPVNGIQPIRMVLFVDEAHLLLPKEGKAGLLGSLARQGRSWGFPVWLASQDADAFITGGENATDFAELATAGLHFSPQTLKPREQKDILGATVTKPLEKGEAVLRLGGKTTTGATRQFWRDGGEP